LVLLQQCTKVQEGRTYGSRSVAAIRGVELSPVALYLMDLVVIQPIKVSYLVPQRMLHLPVKAVFIMRDGK
jgi:hypothetical protein